MKKYEKVVDEAVKLGAVLSNVPRSKILFELKGGAKDVKTIGAAIGLADPVTNHLLSVMQSVGLVVPGVKKNTFSLSEKGAILVEAIIFDV